MSEPQSLSDFLKWTPEPMTVVLDRGLMFAGSKVILYGRYKAMKSMLALRFMLSCATGDSWLGFNTPKQGLRVLYRQLEVPKPQFQERVLIMTGGSNYVVKHEPMIWT